MIKERLIAIFLWTMVIIGLATCFAFLVYAFQMNSIACKVPNLDQYNKPPQSLLNTYAELDRMILKTIQREREIDAQIVKAHVIMHLIEPLHIRK